MITQEEPLTDDLPDLPAHILLAEDDPDVRSWLALALRGVGYEVTEFPDGEALWRHLAAVVSGGEPLPDMIVSDVNMPGWTGLEVLEKLRCRANRTPVILITAYGDSSTSARARQLGAAAVFEKPFDVDDLQTVVLNALPRRIPSNLPRH